LLDCRHEPQSIDLEFIEWIGGHKIPFVICFTKTDKLSSSELHKSITNYKEILLQTWESLPRIFLTSSLKRKGKEEILDFIIETNRTVNI
jgi:GTP-binding protein